MQLERIFVPDKEADAVHFFSGFKESFAGSVLILFFLTPPLAATLEKLYRAAVQHGVMICGGSFSIVLPNGTVVTQFDKDRYWGYTFEENGLWQYRDYQFDFGYHRFL